MDRSDILFYLEMLFLVFFVSFVMLVTPIYLEPQHIPEILSGITSSISLMLGFTATILAIMFQKKDLRRSHFSRNVVFVLVIPIGLLFWTYYFLAIGFDLQDVLRLAIINLAVSVSILFSILRFLTIETTT